MICIDAFKNLNIVTKQGDLYISPCCLTPLEKVEKIQYVDDPYLKRVRTAFLENRWPQECKTCEKSESKTQTSRRIDSNRWYTDNSIHDVNEDLVRIDYWVGDSCNLACTSCGPENSSLWKQELQIPIKERHVNRNTFWQDLDIAKLKYVHFHGGEPLLSKEHKEFLHAIPNKSQVHVYYNTNGTIRASQDLLDLWREFKLIQIDFSIDDIDHRFNYLRFPARWPTVRDNLFWFRDHSPDNCMFGITTVISVLNLTYLPYLVKWIEQNFSTNRFADPVEHRFQSAQGILSPENTEKTKIVEYLSKLDQRRKTDWKLTFPQASRDILCSNSV